MAVDDSGGSAVVRRGSARDFYHLHESDRPAPDYDILPRHQVFRRPE